MCCYTYTLYLVGLQFGVRVLVHDVHVTVLSIFCTWVDLEGTLGPDHPGISQLPIGLFKENLVLLVLTSPPPTHLPPTTQEAI